MSTYYLSIGRPDHPSKRLCELRLPSAQSAEAAAELLASAMARRTEHDETGYAWVELEGDEHGLLCVVVISACRPDARTELYEELDRTLALRDNSLGGSKTTIH